MLCVVIGAIKEEITFSQSSEMDARFILEVEEIPIDAVFAL